MFSTIDTAMRLTVKRSFNLPSGLGHCWFSYPEIQAGRGGVQME